MEVITRMVIIMLCFISIPGAIEIVADFCKNDGGVSYLLILIV